MTDSYDNLDRAEEIVGRIEIVRKVRAEIVAAFARDELDGGRKAAFAHPLYLQAEARLTDLHEQLKGLI